jgi:hypothetical protein
MARLSSYLVCMYQFVNLDTVPSNNDGVIVNINCVHVNFGKTLSLQSTIKTLQGL